LYRILLIDDDEGARREAGGALRSLGHDVAAVDAGEAMWLLGTRDFDVVIAADESDRARDPERETPSRVPASLVYLPRPLSADRVAAAVTEIAEREAVRAEQLLANEALTGASPIVGKSPTMLQLLDRISAVAESDAPVLLTGESGTGKDLIARAIFGASPRRGEAFVAVNCAAFPETLLEAELFGHERGAFTGALQRREGRFKAADRGTLFLDEVNGLSLASQAKLLRVLQDGTFQPIGTNATVSVDVRLVSATNRDLRTLVADGKFREDLYYRIKVLDLEVPPLRARHGDIPLLVQHFLMKHVAPGREPPTVSPGAWAALTHHPFPGNVREIEHAIQHAVVMSRGHDIEVEHLPRELTPALPTREGDAGPRQLGEAVREFERAYIERVLRDADGNRSRAARLLGISRKTLWTKLGKSESGPEHVDGTDGGHET
jgi:DNA-binding NtrC family response regulator